MEPIKLRDEERDPGFGFPDVHHGYQEPSAGAKDDAGKLRMDLIPAVAIHELFERDILESLEGTYEGAVVSAYALVALASWRAHGSKEELVSAFANGLLFAGHGSLFEGLREVARVLEYGAFRAPRPDGTKGYGENNWQDVPDAVRRYYAAALRHGTAPDTHDTDSGLSHWAHFACCCAFLLHLTA